MFDSQRFSWFRQVLIGTVLYSRSMTKSPLRIREQAPHDVQQCMNTLNNILPSSSAHINYYLLTICLPSSSSRARPAPFGRTQEARGHSSCILSAEKAGPPRRPRRHPLPPRWTTRPRPNSRSFWTSTTKPGEHHPQNRRACLFKHMPGGGANCRTFLRLPSFAPQNCFLHGFIRRTVLAFVQQ